jgi:hypothetical protein
MAGFLLQKDAVEARSALFDEWIADRRREAEAAAQAAQQAAQEAAQRAAAEFQARRDALERTIAAAAPPPPPEPPPLPAPTPEPAQPLPALLEPSTPEAQTRSAQFDAWLRQQQVLADLLENAQPPGKAFGGFQAPDLSSVGDFFDRLGSTLNPPLEAEQQAEVERRRLEREATGADRVEITPGRIADILFGARFGTPGPMTGTPEEVKARLEADIAAANPLRDVPVVGGATTLGAQLAVDPMTWLPLPGVQAGRVEAVAPRIAEAVAAASPRLTRQAGQVDAMLAARLGGTLAGGLAGAASTPEDADPFARAAHIGGGALAGFTAPGLVKGAFDLGPRAAELEALRQRGLMQGPRQAENLATRLNAMGLGNLLTGPATHLANIASQLTELARQPIVAAASGKGDEAMAGLRAAAGVIPDAVEAAIQSARTGRTSTSVGSDIRIGPSLRVGPVDLNVSTPAELAFRALGAADEFFKTVGQGMGRGMEARRVLNEAGSPRDPTAIADLVQQNAQRILDAGDRAGRLSVFGEGAETGLGRWLSETRTTLLNSPNLINKAAGMLMGTAVPFSTIPERVWNIGLKRALGLSEIDAAAKVLRGIRRGDTDSVHRALGEEAINGVINLAAISHALNGNITGPDDPEHPSSIRLGGQWFSYENWGPFALQFAIPAAVVESVRKTNNLPDQQFFDYAGNALKASAKSIIDLNYLDNALRMAGALGRGDLPGLAGEVAGSLERHIPAEGFLAQFERAFDQNVREINPGAPGERWASKVPGLAGLLPAKISPTTGEPLLRTRAGPLGVLLRAETQESDPLRQELARLSRVGYDLPDLEQYPKTVSWRGVEIKLRPGEQRAITSELGQLRAGLVGYLNDPGYQSASDDAKAMFLNRYLDRIERLKTASWLGRADPTDAELRQLSAQRVAGRLVNQSELLPQLRQQQAEAGDQRALAMLTALGVAARDADAVLRRLQARGVDTGDPEAVLRALRQLGIL